MGWELRKGRRYLYRNIRVNGRPRKEYLAADGDFGLLMADKLQAGLESAEEVREVLRGRRQAFRAAIDAQLTETATENDRLRTLVEGTLVALGFHNHHRGEWRMARNNGLGSLLATLQEATKQPAPLVNYMPPARDAEAVELFAKARAGDAAAVAAVRKLIVDRKWEEWVGNLGTQAAHQIIARGTAGDEVWKAGINEKLQTLWKELGGSEAPMMEKLLIRRILNGWLSVHMLEIQQAVRPPAAIKEREYLDRALSKAQRRHTEAITTLARVRRLKLPTLIAKVNVC